MNAKLVFRNTAIAALFAAAGLASGCDATEGDRDSPSEAAREALKIDKDDGHQRTVETQRDLNVVDERTIVDRKTGEVVATEKKVTPVRVEKTKDVETHVEEGKTTKTSP